jgi:AcrR family transcriptional regulator
MRSSDTVVKTDRLVLYDGDVPAARPPDPARRNEQARRAIHAAARDLVAELGLARVTVESIAARAGVGKQTIYRWWPDKSALVVDAYVDLVQASGDLDFPDTGDLAADLRTVLHTTIDDLADPGFERRYRALLTAIQDDAALAASLHERLLGPWLDATRRRLRAAPEARHAGDLDLEVAAEVLYGAVYYRWLLRTGPLSRAYADTVVNHTLRALPGRRRAAR